MKKSTQSSLIFYSIGLNVLKAAFSNLDKLLR